MDTIIYITKTQIESGELCLECVKNKISFEFLNGNEFYFTIYDENDYLEKKLF